MTRPLTARKLAMLSLSLRLANSPTAKAAYGYRALGGITLALVLLAFTVAPLWAEEVVYPDEFPPKALQTVPNPFSGDFTNAVAPSQSASGKSPSLSGNTIILNSGGPTPNFVIGATNSNDSDAVTGNQVIINGGTVNLGVTGGVAENIITGNGSAQATASDNSVTINNGTLGDSSSVTGGTAGAVVANGNGSAQATASGNHVAINGGTVGNSAHSGSVAGGSAVAAVIGDGSAQATASGNSVTVGGSAQVSGDVSGGQAVEALVTGDGSAQATASGNSVTVGGSAQVTGEVYGGQATALVIGDGSAQATASGNSVTIGESAQVSGDVYGGQASAIVGGAGVNSAQGTASNNTVTVGGSAQVLGDVYGGWATSDVSGAAVVASGVGAAASNNTVTVNGSAQVAGGVYGGYAVPTSGAATASNNSVTVNGSAQTGDVYGGFSVGDAATASYNRVTISGGTVGNVYGGTATSGVPGVAAASHNSVVISGGTVSGYVYGGYADSGDATATATYNTITLSGAPSFDPANTMLLGGYAANGGEAFTGNTLNLWNYHGSAVGCVEGVQFFNFLIPATQSGPVLTVTGVALLGDGNRGSTVTAINTNGARPMRPGARVTLIQAGTLFTDDFTQKTTQGRHGATIGYLWDLDADSVNGALTATAASVRAVPQAKALSEGFLSGLALANQGADLIAGKGMADALHAAGAQGRGFGFGAFGSVAGGWSRYNTGSHVDMSSLSLLAGLSLGADLPPGRLTLGAFFEYGTGAYNTYNAFANAADVDGKGNSYYLGGGVLARMDFVNTGPGNFYTEASFRAGGLHNDYNSADLRDPVTGRRASYNAFTPYYGVHAGLGYIWKVTEAASLDLYGKYFWTRQQGTSLTLSTGDPLQFKDADSHRVRLGGRLAYAVNDYVTPYVGAAWEYEFDGRQRATVYDDYALNRPSLCGSTGIGEVGLTLKPSQKLPLSFDVGVQGYVGKREGVTGSLQMRYEF